MRFDAVPKELLERCRRDGNGSASYPHAYDELCAAVQPDLYAFLYSLLRNHDDTDDALVECLVRVYRHLPKLQDLEKFPAWIMRMAVNQVQTMRVRNAARATSPLEDGKDVRNSSLVAHSRGPASPRDSAEGKQIRALVDRAIGELPMRQRAAIMLYEVEQMSVREVADALECSDGAVKFHLHEARKKLRVILGPLLRPDTAPREGARP